MSDEPAFEWDEAKSLENLRERGFDFEFATRIFDAPRIEEEDLRKKLRRAPNYGDRQDRRWFLCCRVHTTRRAAANYFCAAGEEEKTRWLLQGVPGLKFENEAVAASIGRE